jgi:hypothetical protein
MRIRRITISAAFAAGLAALPLSTSKAQHHPHLTPNPGQQVLSWRYGVTAAF